MPTWQDYVKAYGPDLKKASREYRAGNPIRGGPGRSSSPERLNIPIRSGKAAIAEGETGRKRAATYQCGNCGVSIRAQPGPAYRQGVEAHKANCHPDTKEHEEGAEDLDDPGQSLGTVEPWAIPDAEPRRVA